MCVPGPGGSCRVDGGDGGGGGGGEARAHCARRGVGDGANAVRFSDEGAAGGAPDTKVPGFGYGGYAGRLGGGGRAEHRGAEGGCF